MQWLCCAHPQQYGWQLPSHEGSAPSDPDKHPAFWGKFFQEADEITRSGFAIDIGAVLTQGSHTDSEQNGDFARSEPTAEIPGNLLLTRCQRTLRTISV
jgi:hypothetical protein